MAGGVSGEAMSLRKALAVVVCAAGVGLYVLSVDVPPALACTCASFGTETALGRADAVFSGKVIKVRYLDGPGQESRDVESRFVVTFEVGRTWKGVKGREFILHTFDNSVTCHGYYFREGEEYIVFAYKNRAKEVRMFEPHKLPEESFGVSLCGGTKPLSEARKDLEVLGEGDIPQ